MRSPVLFLFGCVSCWAHAQTEVVLDAGRELIVVQLLTPEALSTIMGVGPVHVYDCNEPDTHEFSHIPGTVLIVYDEVTADKLPEDLNAPLVFYCYSLECPAASMAAQDAVGLGYTSVYCMEAGIIGWEDAGLPTESGQ